MKKKWATVTQLKINQFRINVGLQDAEDGLLTITVFNKNKQEVRLINTNEDGDNKLNYARVSPVGLANAINACSFSDKESQSLEFSW